MEFAGGGVPTLVSHLTYQRQAGVSARREDLGSRSVEVDDFTVALRVGATYAFAVSLDEYWSEATKEFGLKLTPGRYRISAWFDGNGAMVGNVDMKGVALLSFWKGTVRSSVLEFEVTP